MRQIDQDKVLIPFYYQGLRIMIFVEESHHRDDIPHGCRRSTDQAVMLDSIRSIGVLYVEF